MADFRISAVVSGSVDGARVGLAGMTVKLLVKSKAGDQIVAQAYTSADGKAEFLLDPPADAIRDDGSVLVREIVEDRNGTIVDEAKRSRSVKPGKVTSIRCRLGDAAVEAHLAEPLQFDVSEGRVDRASLEGDINLAIESLAAPGSIEFGNLQAAALCPGPPLDLFDELILDAIDVFDSDPVVIDRFNETLTIIEDRLKTTNRDRATSNDAVTGLVNVSRATELIATTAIGRTTALTNNALTNVAVPSRVDRNRTGRNRAPTLVPREHGAIAMAAAAHVADSPIAAFHNMGIIFETLCGFEEAGALRDLAIRGLSNPGELNRFRGILGARGGEWGPDDGPPIPDLPGVPCDPAVFEHQECLDDIAQQLQSGALTPKYYITGIDRPDACPGETIVISGSGFTDMAGTVEFRRRNASRIEVEADSWTDTRIEVEVPADATCGVRLKIYDHSEKICGRFVDVYRRPAISVDFEGGAATVTRLLINGSSGVACVQPGGPIRIAWDTCAAETTEVVLRNNSGAEIFRSPDPQGTITRTAPSGQVVEWTVTATVTGRCAPTTSSVTRTVRVEGRPDLKIHGVEVTQAIQHYRADEHLTSQLGGDNSIALTVGKMAWVRVYLRSGLDVGDNGGDLDGVTGTLRLFRIVGGSAQFVTELLPINSPMTARSDYATYQAERGDINATLNFQIPAAQMTGRLRLVLEVEGADSCHGAHARDTDLLEVNVAQRNRLRLRGVPFSFDPPSGSGLTSAAAPTVAQFRADAALAYAHWPVAAMRNQDATFTAPQSTPLPLNDPRISPGACSVNWNILLGQLSVAAALDGRTNTVYYGYLPSAIPVNVPGCGGGGQSAGLQGGAQTMSHEIGHAIGRGHSPCGNTPGDNSYPLYSPYDTVNTAAPNLSLARASIGEFGLDIRNGAVFDPASTSDLMSYCRPRWISKYVHNQVFSAPILNPTPVPVGAPGPIVTAAAPEAHELGGSMETSPRIVIWGMVAAGDVDVSTLVRLTTTPNSGAATDLVGELLAPDGTVMATGRALALIGEAGCGCGGTDGGSNHGGAILSGPDASFSFRLDIDDVAMGDKIRIRRGDDVVWERDRPNRGPRVDEANARIRRDGQLEVKWSSTVGDRCVPTAWITCDSPTGGDHQGLAGDVAGSSRVIDVRGMAGGEVVVKVMVSDGFSCHALTTKLVTIPAVPDSAVVLYPTEGEVLPAEGTLCLSGLTSDGADHPIDECEWRVDGKVVGNSADVVIAMPEPGKHTVELRAGDAVQRHGFVVAPFVKDADPDNT